MNRVLVTGSSKGIGAKIAEILANEGYQVFLTLKKNHGFGSDPLHVQAIPIRRRILSANIPLTTDHISQHKVFLPDTATFQ